MFEIDGSKKSGSGTLLRLSVALAAVLNQPLHILNIRQSRPQPGLKPQHLEAVLTAAKLCNAEVEGARLGSCELWFRPNGILSGNIEAEIGTAGSIPMLLMTVLPICAFAKQGVQLRVSKGGTDVPHSPTINYLRFVFFPTLEKIGLTARLKVGRYGYYPKGGGEATLNVEPCKPLKPLVLEAFGRLKGVRGVSVCTFLSDRKVAERQAKAAERCLGEQGLQASIEIVNDRSNPMQKGSSIVLWAETDTGMILGADAVGELRKPSETVGKEAAERLCNEISAKPTVDTHMADMLIPYLALTKGHSTYLTGRASDHLEANIWLAEQMLGVHFNIRKNNGLFKVEKAT